MPAGTRRHFVGKTLINVSYCGTTYTVVRLVSQLMITGTLSLDSIIFEQRNKSSPINSTHYVIMSPTKWRQFCNHRFCDVTSHYVYRPLLAAV